MRYSLVAQKLRQKNVNNCAKIEMACVGNWMASLGSGQASHTCQAVAYLAQSRIDSEASRVKSGQESGRVTLGALLESTLLHIVQLESRPERHGLLLTQGGLGCPCNSC